MNKKSTTKFWKAVGIAGLIAGTLDIIAACALYYINSGKGPMNVLLYIACGAFGPSVFTGGIPMAFAGLLFHYFIAFCFTFLLFELYPKVNGVAKNDYVKAVFFGLIIWTIMNVVVLPLSEVPKSEFNLIGALKGVVVLILAVALPVSLAAHKYYSRRGNS